MNSPSIGVNPIGPSWPFFGGLISATGVGDVGDGPNSHETCGFEFFQQSSCFTISVSDTFLIGIAVQVSADWTASRVGMTLFNVVSFLMLTAMNRY